MNTCETCGWWKDGYCDLIQDGTKFEPAGSWAALVVSNYDHSTAVLQTKPYFGCVLHESKERKA